MEHAPGPPAAGAALGVAADRPLVVEEVDGLLQHRFRKPQLGMGIAEVVHQRRGVAVALEQALENPAHGKLQPQVLNGRLLEEGANGRQTGRPRRARGSHHNKHQALGTC